MSKTLEEVRCQSCTKLLCKRSTNAALRPGELIEIKCAKCNTVNYLMGQPD